MNKTIDFYNQNAINYAKETLNVDFKNQREILIKYLERGAYILDLGCGAGRDSKAFKDLGFNVCAVDGSQELCKIATALLEQEVFCMLFSEIDFDNEFDAVWACSSLLHVPMVELRQVFKKIIKACKNDAHIYLSFKLGDFEIIQNGRFFTYLNGERLRSIIKEMPLQILEEVITADVRKGRENESWYNVILKKT